MAGAIWAAEAGCKVIILESEDRIGGSTALSDGVFDAADTSLQRKLGLTDSIDAYYDYYMTLNAWRQPAALIRRFCEEATPTLEWLMSIGVTYPERIAHKPKQPVFPGSVEGGSVYINGMENRRAVLGVELVLKTRVQQLIVEDGAVKGVEFDGQKLRSHAVLLACGGIANADHQMVRAWFPDAYDTLPEGYHPRAGSAVGSRW